MRLGPVLTILAATVAAGSVNEPRPIVGSLTFDHDGEARIECVCLQGGSVCGLAGFDTLAGNPTVTWTQEVFVRSGKAVDVSAACYRKRNADGHGNGLCCEPTQEDGEPDEEEMRAWFGAYEQGGQ